MQKYHDAVIDEQGNGVTTASIYVYSAGGGLASIFKDDESTAVNNPITSADTDNYDSKGNFGFKAANGVYDIKIVAADTTWKTERVLFDDADYSAGNGIYNGGGKDGSMGFISQRGDFTSPTAYSNGNYNLDRWAGIRATVTATVQNVSGALKFVATSSGTGYIGAHQIVEHNSKYAGKTVTFSALVTSNHTDARLRIDDGVSTYQSTAHTGGGGEELLTLTISIDSSASQLACQLFIFDNASVSVTSGDYIEFTDVRLDLGSHRLSGDREYADEFELCRRYFRNEFQGSGKWTTTTSVDIYAALSPPMRTAPTAGTPSGNIGEIGVSNRAVSAVTNTVLDENGGFISFTTAAATAGNIAGSDFSLVVPLSAEF